MRAVLAAAIFCLLLCAIAVPAKAKAAHRHHHHHWHHWHHHYVAHYIRTVRHGQVDILPPVISLGAGGILTVPTAAGISITVAAHLASRFQALIADFVNAGYRPRRIGCFARGGHVPNSRHHVGAACDFDQRGWGKTVGFMYRAHAIIARHGFRDGCSFGDCGHVDDGVSRYARRSSWNRFGG